MSRRILYVGDPHATPDDLPDCEALVRLVGKVADKMGVDEIVFLGDQYHTHALVHVEVMAFWKRAIAELSTKHPVTLLVGNHDRPGDSSVSDNALMTHQGDATIVAAPMVRHGILFLPFYHDNEAFVKVCRDNANLKIVVCHQAFNGGKYENGVFMADGVAPEDIPQVSVISGHIHSPQWFGKVWYPGAPRWRTLADANVERAIHVVRHDGDGGYDIVASFDTGRVCRKIVFRTVTPDDLRLPEVSAKDRVAIDVRGPNDFVEEKAKELKAMGFRVRKYPYLRKNVSVRESEGIGVAFGRFVDSYRAPNGTPADQLRRGLDVRLFG